MLGCADAFEELQAAVNSFVTIAWPDPLPPLRPGKNARGHGRDAGLGAAPTGSRRLSLDVHLRGLSAALLGDSSGSALMPLSGGCAATASQRLLLSLSLSILQSDCNGALGTPSRSVTYGAVWEANSNYGNGVHSEDASNDKYTPESESAGSRSPAARRRDESKGARKKRGGSATLLAGNGTPGDSTFDGLLLLKAVDFADPLLSDMLSASTKLEAIFKSNAHPASLEPKATAVAAGTTSGQDSSGHLRKKGARPSTASPQNTAGKTGPGAYDEVLREAIRAAQRAAAALPLSLHAELFWRCADLKEAVPSVKLGKLWKTLTYRLIFM